MIWFLLWAIPCACVLIVAGLIIYDRGDLEKGLVATILGLIPILNLALAFVFLVLLIRCATKKE